jgi:dihydrofolate synthase / folylpolyglutamate synthase
MTYAQAIQFLYDLRWFGTKLGLENTFKLAALAGNPQDKLRFIHVAGTNGKGSTCAMLESIYRHAGLRVGLYTSPHLIAFGERIQVNRHLLDQEQVISLVSRMQSLAKAFPAQGYPTFFEAVTVMALLHFAERKCELVIWETGLGGRLDATNIVTPLASVITNIDLDHQQWLGDTFDKIASEKAGIIKPGIPVITGATDAQGLEVISGVARQNNAPLDVVSPTDSESELLQSLQLSLDGRFQRLNAALALKTVQVLSKQLPVSREAMVSGLSHVQWPGRMQRLVTASGQHLLLDGAHNPAGVEVLRAELETNSSAQRPTIVFGVLRDKDWTTMARRLMPLAGRIVLTPVKSERSLSPGELQPFLNQLGLKSPITLCGSLAEALRVTAEDALVVITGSLYLVGEAMELLQLSAVPAAGERELNEWQGTRYNFQNQGRDV